MIKFKVWQSGVIDGDYAHPGDWYAHMIAGNSRILWQSEGYRSEASAHKVCKSTWNAISNLNLFNQKDWPVPYTKDSLLPKAKKAS